MVNVNKLKGCMKEKNLSQKQLAEMLNINVSTLNRKLNGCENSITIGEANEIVKCLGLNNIEATNIFFTK